MLSYRVTSDKARVVDGLGVFEADESRTFTQTEVDWFKRLRGIPLQAGNVPEGVEVTIVVSGDEGDEQ
jgi:hypothetical protein